jgi:tetratricopeptide (TPR) repeat protein
MSGTEAGLWTLLAGTDHMAPGPARTALLEDIMWRADIGGHSKLASLARRLVAEAYCQDGRWERAFPLFDQCLSEFDLRPWEFGPDEVSDLVRWLTFAAQSMADFPDIPLRQIGDTHQELEQRLRAAGQSPRGLYAARRRLAQMIGDWDAEERAYRQWIAAGGPDPDDVWDFEAELERLVLRGDAASMARAYALAEPVLSGERRFAEPAVPVQCLMLLPLVRAGEHRKAALVERRIRRAMAQGAHRYEYLGMRVEFYAHTGNEYAGIDLLGLMEGFDAFERPSGKLEFAIAVAVLTGRLTELGRGGTLIDLGDGRGPVSFQALRDRTRGIALDLAARFDARNGSTAYGDRIRARLVAEPVADFVPLRQGSRRRLGLLPPRGLSDEQVLDRAEWHNHRSEPDEARACLAAVGDLPERLAARAVELRAMFFQSPETESGLRWAAEVHQRYGDRQRSLLTRCWLGLWVAYDGRAEEGVALTAEAVAGLRDAGSEWARAWGEHWLAYVLAGQGRRDGAYAALRRAEAHAARSGDPLVVGVVAGLAATWRNADLADPRQVIELATSATKSFVAVSAGQRAVEAVEQFRIAAERAGAEGEFAAFVDRQLVALREEEIQEEAFSVASSRGREEASAVASGRGRAAGSDVGSGRGPAVPPVSSLDRLRGHLRYLRGRRLIEVGRAAEAVDDLYEAVGLAATTGQDGAELWYHLVVAAHADGRFSEAVDAGLRVTDWLDRLRETGDPAGVEWADNCRLLLADSYRGIGERMVALDEYERVVRNIEDHTGGVGVPPARALSAIAELYAELDRGG